MIIQKRLDSSTKGDWQISVKDVGVGYLNYDNAFSTTFGSSGRLAYNTNTSTVYKFGAGSSDVTSVNTDGADYISFCFSSVEGYSKIGSYSGNGNADGTFVYTGFRPAFVMIKRTNEAASWGIYDNKRAGYNADNDFLHPDLPQAESDGSAGTIDLLSNGFKCRDTSGWRNESNDDYIYIAFAERPFKYSNAR